MVGITPSKGRFVAGRAAAQLRWPSEAERAGVTTGWGIDGEGYVTREQVRVNGVMGLAEVQAGGVRVPCVVEAFVRAREALADAPVLARRPRRCDTNF